MNEICAFADEEMYRWGLFLSLRKDAKEKLVRTGRKTREYVDLKSKIYMFADKEM